MKKYFLLATIALSVFMYPKDVAASGASTLLIDEFRTRSDASSYDEYISLANYSSSEVDLTGFSVYKKTASLGSKPELIYLFGSYELSSQEKVILGGADFFGTNFLPYNGKETLADTNNVIILKDKEGATVDSVAFGSVSYPDIEGTALKNPARAVPYKRTTIPENNDNATDFEAYFPSVPLDPNASKLVISELMPVPSEGKEWFELFNPTNLSVSLGGLKVCDAVGSVHCYFFSEDEVLAPFQYKTYDQMTTKITMNNTGDWLELRDGEDNLFSDSGGNYGSTDDGVSLSLFGSDFLWTKTATPNAQNFFTDTVEQEEVTIKASKSTSKKVKAKTAAKVTTRVAEGDIAATEEEAPQNDDQAVIKGASTAIGSGNKTLGYSLITLAVLLLVGYNLWEKRDYARKIYNKISRRDR